MKNYLTNAIKELQTNEFKTEIVSDKNTDDIWRTMVGGDIWCVIIKFHKHKGEDKHQRDFFIF